MHLVTLARTVWRRAVGAGAVMFWPCFTAHSAGLFYSKLVCQIFYKRGVLSATNLPFSQRM